MAGKSTRQSLVCEPGVVFPALEHFSNPTKLPLISDVIGVIRHKIVGNRKTEDVLQEVTDMVYNKWFHDSVYCLTKQGIKKKLLSLWKVFKDCNKKYVEGIRTGQVIEKYNQLAGTANKLFDVFASDSSRQTNCMIEWGVQISAKEEEYLIDQRDKRLMCCDRQVDPDFTKGNLRKERLKKKSSIWEYEKSIQFDVVDTVDDIPVDNPESTDECVFTPPQQKKRCFDTSTSFYEDGDPLPYYMRHIRTSERVVRDEVYECLAELQGYGLSVNESTKSMICVAKKLFGRNWKQLEDNIDTFDKGTLPDEKNIRTAMTLIETKGLKKIVTEVEDRKLEDERTITHATDSTTKRVLGQFGVSGLHVGKNVPFPMPLFPVCGESTEDIAAQCNLIFEILAVVEGSSVDKLYDKLVDTHLTDFVEHNKGFAKILKEMYDLDNVKGQLFCGVHTILGFSVAMNKILAVVERDMTLEAILDNFMIDLDFDSKHGSIAGQACDVILRLVAPEFLHKNWNYYKDFLTYLGKQNAEKVLFAYKDQHFVCLSRECAVIIYLKDYLASWLSENPGVTNRLVAW